MKTPEEKQSFGNIVLVGLCAGLGYLLLTKGIGLKGALGGGLGALLGACAGGLLHKLLFAAKVDPPAPRIPETKEEAQDLARSLRERLQSSGKDGTE